MARQYFGTDGIRGEIGKAPLTPDFALKLGWAAGQVLASEGNPLVVIGKDTRISGYMLESALQAGLVSAGVNIRLLGPMPTPAVAYLTRTFRASAGIVISASHNPYYDNGVKFFGRDGTKLSDELEEKIELYTNKELTCVPSRDLGKAERVEDASGRYIEFCKRTIPARTSLSGLRIVLDCANGANYHVTPDVLTELGADVIAIHNAPDGVNINHECGATSLESLIDAVQRYRADVGIALDGDGDRVMFVDDRGEVVDGDEALAIIASHRYQHERLSSPVVGTLMSNLGLEQAIKGMGVEFLRADVGDRYVMQLLRKKNGMLGGESSGHVIVRDRIETGDGTIAALQVLQAMIETDKSLHDIKKIMQKMPQSLINVKVKNKDTAMNSNAVAEAVKDVESQLGSRGRVLLRPSGTEPKVRVMIEGEDAAEAQLLAEQIADTVRAASA